MARCKGCGRHIKLKYDYKTGDKNELLDNRIVPKKSSANYALCKPN